MVYKTSNDKGYLEVCFLGYYIGHNSIICVFRSESRKLTNEVRDEWQAILNGNAHMNVCKGA